jgi:hypothetical protein
MAIPKTADLFTLRRKGATVQLAHRDGRKVAAPGIPVEFHLGWLRERYPDLRFAVTPHLSDDGLAGGDLWTVTEITTGCSVVRRVRGKPYHAAWAAYVLLRDLEPWRMARALESLQRQINSKTAVS